MLGFILGWTFVLYEEREVKFKSFRSNVSISTDISILVKTRYVCSKAVRQILLYIIQQVLSEAIVDN